RPNRTDSGNLLCRKARQVLRIPEDRIVDPEEAMAKAATGGTVVFLDDFIGSGDQFVYTWERARGGSSPMSFKETFQAGAFVAAYVSLVATNSGLDRVSRDVPGI